jgi:NTP pyrophosphatase (non-canonical NTP hydrolase)
MISDDVIKKILKFRDDRDWKQFHNGKDLAISLNLEASELLELFQWSGTDLNSKQKKLKQ